MTVPREARLRAAALREDIERHNHQYYALDTPLVSDAEYDLLFRELQALEQKYPELITPESPTQRVGTDAQNQFASVRHRAPMLSLSNAFDDEEVAGFDRRARENLGLDRIEYAAEPKFDGLAINLTYIDGALSTGATRGDGVRGDDVTANVKTIRSIPLVIKGKNVPASFEVRGEVFMPKNVFAQLNKEREDIGEEHLRASSHRDRPGF